MAGVKHPRSMIEGPACLTSVCVQGDLKAPIRGQALQSGFCVPGPLRKVFSTGSRVINDVVLGACLVKVRVRLVSYALSYEKAVSDLSEVDEPDRLAGARPWPQRPPRRFHPLEGGSDPPCWRPPSTSRAHVHPCRSLLLAPGSAKQGVVTLFARWASAKHLSAYLSGHTTCRWRGTLTHQSESAHQTSHWTGLCRMLHTYLGEFSFHALE
jgi:hypothetical protein